MEQIENKSISELGKWKWKDEIPNEGDSFVVKNYYRLHNLPIKEYDLADLRFMIGQNEGLEYLVPIAINALTNDIFIETDLYPSDLLCSLLQINNEPNYWKSHEKEKQELVSLYNEQKKGLGNIDALEEIKVKIKDLLGKL
jgi:hypothetical protein